MAERPMTPMLERLTRENLAGVWAAITTPFDEDDRFDAGVFRENVRRLHAAGVHGIYTTDSDGEFYAIELDEFKEIVDVFADETGRLGVPAMVGATWCNTRGVVDRLAYAASRGILGAHVGHPFFMPMTPDSLRTFWDDVRDATPAWFGLVHYNTPRCANYLRGPDYAALSDQVPNLIGTKHVSADVTEFLTLMQSAPELAHLVGEHALTPFAFFGARGVNSWLVNYNPKYMLDWYDDLMNGRWEQARQRQERVHALTRAMQVLAGPGNLHGIVGKALSSTSPFLVPASRTRRPYRPVDPERIEEFRRLVRDELPDLIWQG
jgi:4-hydroxy-tetrahydrodipicolinate synthase